MRIVQVEDDPLQAEWSTMALVKAGHEVTTLSTEAGFLRRLDSLREHPPDLFILDILVPWDDVTPALTPQPNSFYYAGFRCADVILRDPLLCKAPVILFSVLERADVAHLLGSVPGAVFQRKQEGMGSLVRLVKTLCVPKEPPTATP